MPWPDDDYDTKANVADFIFERYGIFYIFTCVREGLPPPQELR